MKIHNERKEKKSLNKINKVMGNSLREDHLFPLLFWKFTVNLHDFWSIECEIIMTAVR